MNIIVIHGRGTKPLKGCKLGYVREVLTESVRRVSRTAGAWLAAHPRAIQLAYYADCFQRITGEPAEPCDSFREPIDRLYQESRACPTWLKFRGLMIDLGVDAAMLLTRFLDPSVRERIMAQQLKDATDYFQRPMFAARVRQRLLSLLLPALRRRQRVVLIAHSFGSIVAYDVLWQVSHEPRFAHRRSPVAQVMTIGSPLGDRLIKTYLKGWRAPAAQRFPTNIVRWDNCSARGDMICHDARIADDFRPMRIRDHVNLCTVYRSRDGRWNPHKLYGYLILPEVGRLVAQQINAARAARKGR